MRHPLLLAFELELDRWERNQLAGRRRSSGQTSIRISKKTLQDLRSLAARIRELTRHDEPNNWGWSKDLAPDELIAAIAIGAIKKSKGMPKSIDKGMPSSSRAGR